jgi:hypothetical protein
VHGRSLAIWAAWVGFVVAAVAVVEAAGAVHDPAPHRWFHHGGFLWPLWTWDFGWYEQIAVHWYPAHPDRTYAFFPLWPWLLRHGPLTDWQLAGIVAAAASAIAFVGVVAARPGGPDWRAALVLACWPGSFALLLAYPDALALAAAVWAAGFALRGWPEAAAPLGAIAAFARPNGFLIAVPLAYLAWRRGARYWVAAAAPVATAIAVHAYFWAHSGVYDSFLRAQSAGWVRHGPGHIGTWLSRVGSSLEARGLLVLIAGVIAIAVVYLAWRVRPLYGLVAAYVFVIPALLLGTRTKQGVYEAAVAAFVLPMCALLWRFGERYRPWAAFATAVVGASLLSGSVQSFYRQALFAFPLMWAPLEGPKILRRWWIFALGLAANVGLIALLTRFPP